MTWKTPSTTPFRRRWIGRKFSWSREKFCCAADAIIPAAVQFLRRYLALNSKVEEAPAFKAHYLLGTALEKQGDKQAAAQEYRAALSLAKDFSRAQEALDRLNR